MRKKNKIGYLITWDNAEDFGGFKPASRSKRAWNIALDLLLRGKTNVAVSKFVTNSKGDIIKQGYWLI